MLALATKVLTIRRVRAARLIPSATCPSDEPGYAGKTENIGPGAEEEVARLEYLHTPRGLGPGG